MAKESTDTKEVRVISKIQKIWEDKLAVSKCIREGGDLGELAHKRNIVFAHPFTL
ncbi:MAG: hypothetical protein IJ524_04530 [Bacteroidales bacterium]|nr:hypothetical protein [Bacteroidales bacterium]